MGSARTKEPTSVTTQKNRVIFSPSTKAGSSCIKTVSYTHLDYSRKEDFLWTSMLRLPEYVTEDVFAWACEEFHKKHPEADINRVRMEWYEEGLCAQILHKLSLIHISYSFIGCCAGVFKESKRAAANRKER